MDYFEHEMQMFFGESALLSADTVFSHRAMVSDIGKDLRAKVEFVNTKITSQYDALKLSIINRTMGVVDTQIFKFSDIIGKKNGNDPYIWENDGSAKWYGYRPNALEFESIQGKVEEYIEIYADQELRYQGHTMGGM